MEELLDKYLNRIIDVYQKKSLPPSNRFDLFDALGETANENAFIYRCGYYIVNKYCNKNLNLKIRDTFYTIYLNALIKFEVMKLGKAEFFEVYKIVDLTDAQITEILSLTNDIEDIERRFVKDIMKHLH